MMKHFFWTKYPFVQVGFAFIGGNALAYTFTDLPEFKLSYGIYHGLLGLAAGMASVIILLLLYSIRKRIKPNGLLLFLLFASLGSIRFLTYDERAQRDHLSLFDQDTITAVIGQVITEPERKKNTLHFLLAVQKVKRTNQWHEGSGKLKITLADTSSHAEFNDLILVTGAPSQPLPADTPYDFDYARFLAYQNIHYTLFARTKPILLKSKTDFNFSFKYHAIQARQQLETLLSKKIKHQRAYALVTGLLIGKRADLEENDKQLFTTSGTIHVLAVSGMHVVLIYQCICFLALLFRMRQHGIVFNLAILALIWFYIFITGLQASASRAAIMITLVLIGKLVQRDNQNTNSLFATACLMLLYHPYYLADAGFILSFLAVAGILLSSELSIRKSQNKIWTYFFNASLISTAAQIATFPYSIHLFRQFPIYFLFANLVVVPLTTVLLFLSVALLIVYHVPYLDELLVFLIEQLTEGLFYFLQFISYLPCPILQHISCSTVEMCLLYLALLMSILLFAQRNIKWLWSIACCLTLLCGSLHYRMIQQFRHPSLFISGKKDSRQYLISAGHQAWMLQCDERMPLNRASALFLTDHFIHRIQTIKLSPQQSFIIQVDKNKIPVVRKRNSRRGTSGNFLENCSTLILDYTVKYSYLDPNNKPITHQKIFSLYGKKSFYSTMSPYEMDQD